MRIVTLLMASLLVGLLVKCQETNVELNGFEPNDILINANLIKQKIPDGLDPEKTWNREAAHHWINLFGQPIYETDHNISLSAELEIGWVKSKSKDLRERLLIMDLPYVMISDIGQLSSSLELTKPSDDWSHNKHAFFIHDSHNGIPEYDLILHASDFHSSSSIEEFQIDLFDEQGFQPLLFDVPYRVQKGYRVRRANLSAEMDFEANMKINPDPDPDPAPWGSLSMGYPWAQFVVVDGQNIYANIYPKLSSDGVFDEPILFVEGIDFGIGTGSLRNGTFGWQEFTQPNAEGPYNFLGQLPPFLQELNDAGKDIVLVDFWDGARAIEHNTQIVKKAIQLCNEYKQSDTPLICVGTSMGGIITRKALKEMENEPNNHHCTSLFVSHDSPHNGAHIPMGIQSILAFASHVLPEVANLQQATLLRPATKQLLLQQYHPYDNWHDNFQASLDAIGMPRDCKNISVVNGSVTGIPLEGVQGGDYLLNYECDGDIQGILNNDVLRMEIVAWPGDPNHPDAIEGGRILSRFRFTQELGENGCETPACEHNHNFQLITNGILNYDIMPGGYRTTIGDLISQFNPIIVSEGCPSIQSWQYEGKHCFIPSYSALGMSDYYAFDNLQEVLLQDPDASIFDDYYASTDNQQHSFFDASMGDWLRPQFLNNDWSHPQILNSDSPNTGTFNMCVQGQHQIGTLEVENGGSFYINEYLPSHFGEAGDELPSDLFFQAKSNACASNIRIGPEGYFQIGSETGILTAELSMSSGSQVLVETGGRLIVQDYSVLIIEEGSELVLRPGAVLDIGEGAQIIIQHGGKIVCDDPSVYLSNDSEILIQGIIEIPVFSQWHLASQNNQFGKLVFDGDAIKLWGSAASFRINGKGADHTMIEILDNSRFWNSNDFSEIKLRNGKITLGSWSQMPITCNMSAKDCKFESTDANGNHGVHVFKQNRFESCEFENTSLFGDLFYFNNNKLIVESSDFHGEHTKVLVNGYGYTIRNSRFYHSEGIRSENMSIPSVVYGCDFFGGDPLGDLYRGIFDDSETTLQVRKSKIQNCGVYGIHKKRGELSVQCSEIKGALSGIHVEHGFLNLSRGFGGGDNFIHSNKVNLQLDFAYGVNLNYGFNRISNPFEENLTGSIYGDCSADCSTGNSIPAAMNSWYSAGTIGEPSAGTINLQFLSDCGGPSIAGCEVDVDTFQMYGSPECNDPKIKFPWRDLNTSSKHPFMKPYTNAIAKAYQKINNNSSIEQLEDAIQDLREVSELTDFNDMDAGDAYWSMLIKSGLKQAIEQLHDLAPIEGFGSAEEAYLDVLSRFDDPNQQWTKSSYRLKHEQQKAALFKLKGNFDRAKSLLYMVQHCGLHDEKHTQNQSFYDHIDAQNQCCGLDLTHLIEDNPTPVSETFENIGFDINGAKNSELTSWNQVDFETCFVFVQNREKSQFGVYPNPSLGSFSIDLRSMDGPRSLTIFNGLGQVIYQNDSHEIENQVELTLNSSGIFTIKVIDLKGVHTQQLVIQ